jgi:hypothetical protein
MIPNDPAPMFPMLSDFPCFSNRLRFVRAGLSTSQQRL